MTRQQLLCAEADTQQQRSLHVCNPRLPAAAPALTNQEKPFLPTYSAVHLDQPISMADRVFGSERGSMDNQRQ
jgi:hypothetical protein